MDNVVVVVIVVMQGPHDDDMSYAWVQKIRTSHNHNTTCKNKFK